MVQSWNSSLVQFFKWSSSYSCRFTKKKPNKQSNKTQQFFFRYVNIRVQTDNDRAQDKRVQIHISPEYS